jgi:hypothetical protein
MFRDALGTLSQTPPKLLDIAQIAAVQSNPRQGAEWYNLKLARRAGSMLTVAAKLPEHRKRARSSIGRASDS